jgi:NTE family protein
MSLLSDFTLPRSGLIQGKRVTSLLKTILGDFSFSNAKLRFACVATDIKSGQQVVLRNGSLIEAIRASISIPGVFTPARVGGRYLVDGGLVNAVPVSVCREMGAEYVIGVNVIPDPSKMLLRAEKRQGESGHLLPDRGSSQSLRSRLEDIEGAIEAFLHHHQPRRQEPLSQPIQSEGIVQAKLLPSKAPSIIDMLSQSLTIAACRVALENLKAADLAITPATENIGSWQFNKAAEAVAVGEEAARRALRRAKRRPADN